MNKKPNEPVIKDETAGEKTGGDGPEQEKNSGMNRRAFLGTVATIGGVTLVGAQAGAGSRGLFRLPEQLWPPDRPHAVRRMPELRKGLQ